MRMSGMCLRYRNTGGGRTIDNDWCGRHPHPCRRRPRPRRHRPRPRPPSAPYRWLVQLRSPLGCSHRSILTNRRCSRAGDAVLAGWPAAAARPMAGGPPLLSTQRAGRRHVRPCSHAGLPHVRQSVGRSASPARLLSTRRRAAIARSSTRRRCSSPTTASPDDWRSPSARSRAGPPLGVYFVSAQLTAIAHLLIADGWRNRCDGLVPPLNAVAQQLDLLWAAREMPSRMISGTPMRCLHLRVGTAEPRPI